MTRKITWLFLLLMLQSGLVIYLWGVSGKTDEAGTTARLIAIDNMDAIGQIEIRSGSEALVLVKKDKRWSMPDYYGLPVNEGMVDSLLSKLDAADTGWVVAQTKSAAERFHVSVDNSRRHLLLSLRDNSKAELFFGDSPGLNSIYVRRQADKKIYSIKLGLHDLSVNGNDWLDKNLLQLGTDIAKISADGFELINQDEIWLLGDLKPDESMNADEVNLLVSYLEKIQVEDIFYIAADKNTLTRPDISLTAHIDNDMIQYDFFSQDDNYFVKSSKHEHYFKIAKFFFENIEKFQRKNLLAVVAGERTPVLPLK